MQREEDTMSRSALTSIENSEVFVKIEDEEALSFLSDILCQDSSPVKQEVKFEDFQCRKTTKHSPNKPDRTHDLSCGRCKKVFTTKRNLRKHGKTHNEPIYPCRTCGKKFPQKRYLALHEERHSEVKKHVCQICTKSFYNKGCLARHLKVHKRKENVKCELCVGLPATECLHRLQKERENKPYECFVCGKRFVKKDYLPLHMKFHSGKKDLECNECGAKFWQRSPLIQHLKQHEGIKPHVCNYCGKRFLRLAHKVDHERSHTGEQPYQCRECPRRFSTDANWYHHLKIHSRPKKKRGRPKEETRWNRDELDETIIKVEVVEEERDEADEVDPMLVRERFTKRGRMVTLPKRFAD